MALLKFFLLKTLITIISIVEIAINDKLLMLSMNCCAGPAAVWGA